MGMLTKGTLQNYQVHWNNDSGRKLRSFWQTLQTIALNNLLCLGPFSQIFCRFCWGLESSNNWSFPKKQGSFGARYLQTRETHDPSIHMLILLKLCVWTILIGKKSVFWHQENDTAAMHLQPSFQDYLRDLGHENVFQTALTPAVLAVLLMWRLRLWKGWCKCLALPTMTCQRTETQCENADRVTWTLRCTWIQSRWTSW